MLAAKDPYINSAYKQLQIISQDREKRLEYEAREKAVRDHNQMMLEAEARGEARGKAEGRAEGKAEGRAEGKYQNSIMIAQNMLAEGFQADTIARITGLTADQIKAL